MTFRIQPLMPPGAYKTYSMRWPLTTHYRPASCAEVECQHHLLGWQTIVPEGSDHAALVRSLKDRYHFTEQAQPAGLVAFTFPPGQACFRASTHRIALEREPVCLVTGGDWRGNPMRTPARTLRVDDWVDDFATHQDRLAREIEKG